MRTFDSIAAEFLKIPIDAVSDALTPNDVPNWDSMNYLLFIAELEKEYGVSFTMDEVLEARSLGDVRKALEKKGIST